MFPRISPSLVFFFFPPELFTIYRLSATCAVYKCVHTLQEEKYVGSELILFLTYREIPVLFNLDCGIQEHYREEKRMCFEQKKKKKCMGSSLLFCCWNLGQQGEKWQAHNSVWQPCHSVLWACQFVLAKYGLACFGVRMRDLPGTSRYFRKWCCSFSRWPLLSGPCESMPCVVLGALCCTELFTFWMKPKTTDLTICGHQRSYGRLSKSSCVNSGILAQVQLK